MSTDWPWGSPDGFPRWQPLRGKASLKEQGCRAADSVVLNIAEGRARGGGAGENHFRIALGSAAEVCAVLDLSRTGEPYALPTEAPPNRSHAHSDVEVVGPWPKVSPGRTVHAMNRLRNIDSRDYSPTAFSSCRALMAPTCTNPTRPSGSTTIVVGRVVMS